MKIGKLILAATLLLVTVIAEKSAAQNDSCIIKLKNANTGFDQGDYDGTIRLLRSALSECSLDKNEKIQANKLLIMSYLKVDNLEEADKTAAAIMKIDPYYKPDKFKDDPKLSGLFEKFQSTPVFRIGISAGMNKVATDLVKTYSIVHNDDAPDLGTYTNKTGFQLGARVEYRAWKNTWVNVGGQYRKSTYEHVLNDVEGTTINYSEDLSYFDIPLSAKYYIVDKTISPYIEAGGTFTFLTNALSTTSRDAVSDLVNRTNYRNVFAAGFFGGVGAAYKMKGFQVYLDARYTAYSKNVNKDGTRYADLTNVFKYYYIDDDFRLNSWQINAGVNYTLAYRNRKVK